MLPSISPRKALLVCPSFPPWNLPFTVESTLSSLCSRSDPPRQDNFLVSLTLTLYPLMIWYSGLTALFLFVLAKAATFSFSAGPVCSNFSAEACAILQALLLVWATPTNLPLLFSYLTLVLSSRLCTLLHLFFYLKLYGRSGRNCLLSPPSVLSG